MRYLCLLAVLCNPDQKGIVCIEEPELGLHPDIIPEVAKLLVEASSRCQLFVTTHSDTALSIPRRRWLSAKNPRRPPNCAA